MVIVHLCQTNVDDERLDQNLDPLYNSVCSIKKMIKKSRRSCEMAHIYNKIRLPISVVEFLVPNSLDPDQAWIWERSGSVVECLT